MSSTRSSAMNRTSWLTVGVVGLLIVALSAPGEDKSARKLDKDQAKKAFEYINKVRKEPARFSKEIGVDLSDVKPRDELKWNDTIAKVAEEKVIDMAKRNYIGHVDPDGIGINLKLHEAGYTMPEEWIKDKKSNLFESIGGGKNTGVEMVKMLLVDAGSARAGHRRHILGIDDFYADCPDIGIGFVRDPNSKFKTYMSILIAKQK
jgi:uncharacterized protein YkwD